MRSSLCLGSLLDGCEVWGSGWGSQLGEFAKVLGGGGEKELVLCARWSAQSQSPQAYDAFEVRKEHLDLLALLAGSFIGRSSDQRSGHIACLFEDAARDLPSRLFRTASGLQRTRCAIEVAGAIQDLVVVDDCAACGQCLAAWTIVEVPGFVKLEVGSGECPIIASGFVEDRDVGRDMLGLN